MRQSENGSTESGIAVTRLAFPMRKPNGIAKHVASKGYRIPEYLKLLLRADMDSVKYVVPNDGRLKDMALHFRRIGVNINQTVHWINRDREVTMKDIQILQKHLMELETVVLDSLQTPKDIITVVKEHLTVHPTDRTHLIQWLYDNQVDKR